MQESLFIVVLDVLGLCVWSLFCYDVNSVLSSFSFTVISLRKRELVASLNLCNFSCCCVADGAL